MIEKLKKLNRLLKNDILKNNILLNSHNRFKFDDFSQKLEEFIKRESLHENVSDEFKVAVESLIKFCEDKKGSLSNEASQFIDMANILLETIEKKESTSEDIIFKKFLSQRSELNNYVIKGILYQKQDFDFGLKVNGKLVAVCETKRISGAQNLLMMTLEDRYKNIAFWDVRFILIIDSGDKFNYYEYIDKKFKSISNFPKIDELIIYKNDYITSIQELLKFANSVLSKLNANKNNLKHYFGVNTFGNLNDESIRNYDETLKRLQLINIFYEKLLKFDLNSSDESEIVLSIEKIIVSLKFINDFISKNKEEQSKLNVASQESTLYNCIDSVLNELFFSDSRLLKNNDQTVLKQTIFNQLKLLHSNAFGKYIISYESEQQFSKMNKLSQKLEETEAKLTGNMGIKTIENIKNDFEDLKNKYYDDALLYLAGFLSVLAIGLFVVYDQIAYFDNLKSIKNLNYIFVAPKVTLSILYFVLIFFLLKGYNASMHLKKIYEHKEMLAKVFENIYDVLDMDDSKNQTIKEYFYKNISESYVQFDDTGHVNSTSGSNMSFDFSKVFEK